MSPEVYRAAMEAAYARTAASRGISTLYKFRRCRCEQSFGYLKSLLQGELWFSPLSDFNDPFEGRPRTVRAFADAAQQRDAIINAATEIDLDKNLSEEEQRKRFEQANAVSLDWGDDYQSDFRNWFGQECYVFSMTASREHPLQWSHYADDHKGVCVHLDARKIPIAAAIVVDYSPKYPEYALPMIGRNLAENFFRCLLTKAEFWSYEAEYRIVDMRGLEPNEKTNWPAGRGASQYSPEIISGITLGARMRDPMRQTLLDWCRGNRPDLAIESASLDDTSYKLNFAAV